MTARRHTDYRKYPTSYFSTLERFRSEPEFNIGPFDKRSAVEALRMNMYRWFGSVRQAADNRDLHAIELSTVISLVLLRIEEHPAGSGHFWLQWRTNPATMLTIVNADGAETTVGETRQDVLNRADAYAAARGAPRGAAATKQRMSDAELRTAMNAAGIDKKSA